MTGTQDSLTYKCTAYSGGVSMENAREIIKNQKNSKAKDSKIIKAKDSIAKDESLADKNKRIEANAIMLAENLKANTDDIRFFCKVLYNLSEGTVAYILEGAKKANKPCNYFCASAKRELDKINV